ncbi:MAG: hypothetical protein M1571_00055 [Firmicutes bacterium]|nr:hypothetical protein [Bacillota bacterium]
MAKITDIFFPPFRRQSDSLIIGGGKKWWQMPTLRKIAAKKIPPSANLAVGHTFTA